MVEFCFFVGSKWRRSENTWGWQVSYSIDSALIGGRYCYFRVLGYKLNFESLVPCSNVIYIEIKFTLGGRTITIDVITVGDKWGLISRAVMIGSMC